MPKTHGVIGQDRDDRSWGREDERDVRQDARTNMRSGAVLTKIVNDADALVSGGQNQRTR